MSVFKNKHVVVALLVAPVLALIAYFATDHIVSEKPHLAKQGQTYKLAAKSNCRYSSGRCTLHNADVEVDVRIERISDTAVKLVLQSNNIIQHALASFADEENEPIPTTLYRSAASEDTWNAEFKQADVENRSLRLVLEISDSIFYAETPLEFIDYETTFSRDNFAR